MSAPLLAVRGVSVSLGRPAVPILREVDLTVRAGEIVGIVGRPARERRPWPGPSSDSSARTRAPWRWRGPRSPRSAGRRCGRIAVRARCASSSRTRCARSTPTTTWRPSSARVWPCGGPPAERAAKVRAALELVGLDPELLGRTPGQISGGQRQRVSIARAIVCEPSLLICDEPVSALDASNRNHILRLLDDLRDRLGVGVVVISHDLSSLAGVADRVAVLYRGRIVEEGPIGEVFDDPRHPYTALLVASAPASPAPPATPSTGSGRSRPVPRTGASSPTAARSPPRPARSCPCRSSGTAARPPATTPAPGPDRPGCPTPSTPRRKEPGHGRARRSRKHPGEPYRPRAIHPPRPHA